MRTRPSATTSRSSKPSVRDEFARAPPPPLNSRIQGQRIFARNQSRRAITDREPKTFANCRGAPPEGESTQDFSPVELPCGTDTLYPEPLRRVVCPLRSRYNTRGQAEVPVLQKPI